MPERDVGHEQTEKILQALERRIAQVYAEARDGVKQTIEKYWAGLAERDKYMRALVQKGEITQDYYMQWLQNQIGRGERYEALQNQLAERVTNAAETAYAYINDTTPSVYSLNRNYGAYTIERATGSVGFTMWNESAVRRLLVQQPELMPHYPPKKALKRGIDLEWGKKQIRAAIQSGILQGKSIGKIANDLQKRIPDMSRKSAIRAARTAMTGAQNGGRQDSYEAAKRMGIKAKKRWIATLDGRTRDSHRRLHGEIAEIDDKFSNGLMFPGDERGRPEETYNCFIDSVKVASDSEIIRSYKHIYEGDLITIKTAGGVKFTCTPNHPILTPSGWVSAKLLHDGDDIFVTVSGKDNMPRVNPYVQHTFPSFDAIHKFLCENGGKRTCSLSVNFHGDIPTSNVEIVSQKRFLRRRWYSGIGKSVDKILFKLSDKTFARKRSFVEHFRRVCAPSFGFMRSRCKALSFLWRRLSHSDVHRFRASADVDSVLAKNPVHDAAAKSMFSREPLNGFSGKIFVDHVISVESSFSRCHVYNLQTQNGYYFVNSIIPQNGGKSNGIFAIAKNCRCDMVADVESLSSADETNKLDPQTQSKIITNDITYGEWAGQKSGIISKDVKKKSDYIGRVYGKTDGQSYITPEGDTYTLTGDGAGKTKEVPKNEDGGVKVYKAPNNSGFLNGVYVNDENKNAIYSNGRIVLNNSAYNNNLRDQMKGMIENETLRLGGLREDGVWYRGTDNPKEIEYIKSGKLRASKNHMTGAIEDGVSVWETPKYSFKYTYQVSGEFVGIGSDGEPLISPDSVKLLSDSAISAKDVSEAMERGKQEFLKEYSWTEEQYDKALKGEYDWKGDLR